MKSGVQCVLCTKKIHVIALLCIMQNVGDLAGARLAETGLCCFHWHRLQHVKNVCQSIRLFVRYGKISYLQVYERRVHVRGSRKTHA